MDLVPKRLLHKRDRLIQRRDRHPANERHPMRREKAGRHVCGAGSPGGEGPQKVSQLDEMNQRICAFVESNRRLDSVSVVLLGLVLLCGA